MNTPPAFTPDPHTTLEQYAIYERPRDYPRYYVVHRWFLDARYAYPIRDPHPKLADTLAEARALIPHGMHQLPRRPEDEPTLVEVWA